MLTPEEVRAYARVHFALMESLGDGAKAGERATAAALLAYEGRFYDGEAFPSIAAVGRLAGLSERAVQGHVDALIDKARLDMTPRLGRSSVYRLRFPGKPDWKRMRRARHTPAETAPPAEAAHDLRSSPALVERSKTDQQQHSETFSPPVPPDARAHDAAAAFEALDVDDPEVLAEVERCEAELRGARKGTLEDKLAALEARADELDEGLVEENAPGTKIVRGLIEQPGHRSPPDEGRAYNRSRPRPALTLVRPTLPPVPAPLLAALRALERGDDVLPVLAESELPGPAATRVVQRILAVARTKGLDNPGGLATTLVRAERHKLDLAAELAAQAEHAAPLPDLAPPEEEVESDEPEPTPTPAPAPSKPKPVVLRSVPKRELTPEEKQREAILEEMRELKAAQFWPRPTPERLREISERMEVLRQQLEGLA